MGDDDRGALPHQFGERCGDLRLAFSIERGRCLVEQEERRMRRMARAMAMLWRCPPESMMPRSPTGVSKP